MKALLKLISNNTVVGQTTLGDGEVKNQFDYLDTVELLNNARAFGEDVDSVDVDFGGDYPVRIQRTK